MRATVLPVLLAAGCLPEGLFFWQGPDGGDVVTVGETDTADTADTVATVPPTECPASVGAPAWSTTLLWEWQGVAAAPDYRHVQIAPVAGDLDGDGRPEIVAVALAEDDHYDPAIRSAGHGWLVVLDGETGLEILAVPDVYGVATRLVVEDLDGDGDDEVLAQVSNRLAALDLGGVLWTADGCGSWNPPAAADLDGDGSVEVVNGGCGILDGATGASRVPEWTHGRADYTELVDVDADGRLDITLGAEVRDAAGALVNALPLRTSRTLPVAGGAAPLSIVADDAHGFTVLDAALAPVGSFERRYTDRPLVCSGDVDADGQAEVVVPAEDELVLFELGGAEVWSAEAPRGKGYPGAQSCVVLDLDLDGCLDVVWPQDGVPRVHDAATGRLRTGVTHAATATPDHEAQPIVDLDGDGTLDLVVGGQDSDGIGVITTWSGIRAYTEATGAWIAPAP